MKYYYRIYGLNIRSEVKLEEAYENEDMTFDVDIQYGLSPGNIDEYRNSKEAKCLIADQCKWFRYENIGEFYIEKGSLIIVHPEFFADEKVIRSIILGPCFGSILYQRRILTIHGSAMVWNNNAVIISGRSGSGKSTISTALRLQGWRFLADDTVALTIEDDGVYANPAYPQQKLCLDTASDFGYDTDQLILINEERKKYAVNVKDVFCSERKIIKAMICLELNDTDRLEIDEVKGNAKLEHIINNLYTYYDFKYMGMGAYDFKQCLEVTQKIPILSVKRPPNLKTQNQIIDRIYRCLENTCCKIKAE